MNMKRNELSSSQGWLIIPVVKRTLLWTRVVISEYEWKIAPSWFWFVLKSPNCTSVLSWLELSHPTFRDSIIPTCIMNSNRMHIIDYVEPFVCQLGVTLVRTHLTALCVRKLVSAPRRFINILIYTKRRTCSTTPMSVLCLSRVVLSISWVIVAQSNVNHGFLRPPPPTRHLNETNGPIVCILTGGGEREVHVTRKRG